MVKDSLLLPEKCEKAAIVESILIVTIYMYLCPR
jgi:hypothetical protein